MQDYERLINHFFSYCNVTITARYIEQKIQKSTSEYSILYILRTHPVEGYDKNLVKFNFKEDDKSITMSVNYVYDMKDKHGLSVDGSLLKEQMNFGRKSMLFFENMNIKHYCPIMCVDFFFDKKSKEISFLSFYQTINIFNINKSYSSSYVDLEKTMDELTDQELILLHEDPTGMSLDDKLCLLAMVTI